MQVYAYTGLSCAGRVNQELMYSLMLALSHHLVAVERCQVALYLIERVLM